MARLFCGKILVGAVVLLTAAGAMAAAPTAKAQRCIYIPRLDHTQIVDDWNILFYMRGGKVYNNHLPYRCQGLSSYRAFKFATSLSQLCNVDIISVVDSSTGRPTGASCGLGMFTLIHPQPKPAQPKPAQPKPAAH